MIRNLKTHFLNDQGGESVDIIYKFVGGAVNI